MDNVSRCLIIITIHHPCVCIYILLIVDTMTCTQVPLEPINNNKPTPTPWPYYYEYIYLLYYCESKRYRYSKNTTFSCSTYNINSINTARWYGYTIATVYIINNMYINILYRTYVDIYKIWRKKKLVLQFFLVTLDHVACVHFIDRNEFFLHTNRQKKFVRNLNCLLYTLVKFKNKLIR